MFQGRPRKSDALATPQNEVTDYCHLQAAANCVSCDCWSSFRDWKHDSKTSNSLLKRGTITLWYSRFVQILEKVCEVMEFAV